MSKPGCKSARKGSPEAAGSLLVDVGAASVRVSGASAQVAAIGRGRTTEAHDAAAQIGRPATERLRVLRSKLTPPPLRAGIIDRPALVDRLVAARNIPVVLISAPAGYGKSSLLALWRERDDRRFAWVSVDDGDDDPAVFIRSIAAALDPIVRLDADISDAFRASSPPLDDVILPALVEACAGAGAPFVLVLDNLHRMSGKRSHTMLAYLAERMPPGCQFAIATRSDPLLPLASLRAHGQLAEVRMGDLALDHGAAEALLSAACARLNADQVARLVERTEGWPAGLYLAALSLRDRAQPDEFINRFAGTSRHVADFFSEDVLARQPGSVIDFVLHTCVLEELTASLCQAMTGRTDAASVLHDLEQNNLFVVPQDEDRQAYRYHHLFAEYLRAALVRREPALIPELNRRASNWYREHGLTRRAIAHARAAGDINAAAELVAAKWSAMVNSGQIETARSWIEGFEEAQIREYAPLAIAAAWISALYGESMQAAAFAEMARQASWDGPLPDGTASLTSALAIISSAFGLNGITSMRRVAQQAADIEVEPNRLRALALQLLGIAQAHEGDFPNARIALAEASGLAGHTSISALSLAHLALMSLWEGDEDRAYQLARRAHAIAELPRMRSDLSSVGTYSVLASLLARRGDVEGASRAIERAGAFLPRLTQSFWWMMIQARISLAIGLHAIGREDEAVMRLGEAEALLSVREDAGILPKWCETVRQEIWPAGDERLSSSAISEAERRVLRLLASDLTQREIASELHLTMNTVKTHRRSIYRKLGVSSRDGAVKAARSDIARVSPRGERPEP